jgi:hypothetical protein
VLVLAVLTLQCMQNGLLACQAATAAAAADRHHYMLCS